MATLITLAATLDFTFIIARILLIIAGCIILCESFKLPGLLYFGVWYVVDYIGYFIGGYFFTHLLPPGRSPGQPLPAPINAVVVGSTLCSEMATFIALLLLFAEAAVLVNRLGPRRVSFPFRFLVRIHDLTRTLGVLAIALAVMSPLIPCIYYYAFAPR
jgi:hypothetical protein